MKREWQLAHANSKLERIRVLLSKPPFVAQQPDEASVAAAKAKAANGALGWLPCPGFLVLGHACTLRELVLSPGHPPAAPASLSCSGTAPLTLPTKLPPPSIARHDMLWRVQLLSWELTTYITWVITVTVLLRGYAMPVGLTLSWITLALWLVMVWVHKSI